MSRRPSKLRCVEWTLIWIETLASAVGDCHGIDWSIAASGPTVLFAGRCVREQMTQFPERVTGLALARVCGAHPFAMFSTRRAGALCALPVPERRTRQP